MIARQIWVDGDRYLTQTTAAREAGVCRRAIQNWYRLRPKLTIKIGNRTYYRIDLYLERVK